MKQYDVTLLTAETYFQPLQPDWYVKQILEEDRLLGAALEELGLTVHRIDWTNDRFDWRSTRSVIFRATWDYTNRFNEFRQFIRTRSTDTVVINPANILLWNLDKHYLLDLAANGIPTVETLIIEKGDPRSLRQVISLLKTDEAIIKPAMSAGARHTYRISDENISHHEELFRELISSEAMMVQPFLESVLTEGEKTLVIIGGKFTHSIMKKAKIGDFRVQDDFGGSVHQYTPTQDEIFIAEKAVSFCSPLPLYGRVDLLRDNEGNSFVSELELIEPELWFRFHPPAATLLATAVHNFLKNQ